MKSKIHGSIADEPDLNLGFLGGVGMALGANGGGTNPSSSMDVQSMPPEEWVQAELFPGRWPIVEVAQ